jgi:hypothetical protein
VTNLLQNNLDVESAKMLAKVVKQKGISLCGIQRDQTTADFRNKGLQPPDAILLASDLSQADVTAACDGHHGGHSVCSNWPDAVVSEFERRELGLLVALDGLADCANAIILEVVEGQIQGRQPAINAEGIRKSVETRHVW